MQVTESNYQNHAVFVELERYSKFYDSVSMSVFSFCTMGTSSACNIDSYVYSSIQGTLESIRTLLKNGRINDSYALLRKYFDSVIINIYCNLYLQDNCSVDSFIVEKINNWLKGKEQLPEYRVMSQYIRSSDKVAAITAILYNDDRYKLIRERCNGHTHYNFYQNVLLNDNRIYLENRAQALDSIASDTRDIFILHLAYIFYLNGHYMMSSDYIDSMDCGFSPEPDCQYWVAPFVQEIFDDVLVKYRNDIASKIKQDSSMHLS